MIRGFIPQEKWLIQGMKSKNFSYGNNQKYVMAFEVNLNDTIKEAGLTNIAWVQNVELNDEDDRMLAVAVDNDFED